MKDMDNNCRERRLCDRLFGLLPCLLALSLAAPVLGGCGRDAQAYLASGQTEQESDRGTKEGPKETEAYSSGGVVLVYVCGEVKTPGVYELAEGSRICDAVDAAGGLTKEASRDYWNLAERLTDGQMISVPTKEEAGLRQESAAAAPVSDGRVNINTAELAELMTIPGVGKTRGEAILAYRSEHGPFAEMQDIKKVPGIGDVIYEGMKDCITAE